MKQTEKASEPPSCLQPPVFMIGQDSRGHWVAQESSGTRGGLFVSRGEALKFAKSEGDVHPHAIVWVSGILELDTGFAPAVRSDRQLSNKFFSFSQRRVA
jgi:hypothetical protein